MIQGTVHIASYNGYAFRQTSCHLITETQAQGAFLILFTVKLNIIPQNKNWRYNYCLVITVMLSLLLSFLEIWGREIPLPSKIKDALSLISNVKLMINSNIWDTGQQQEEVSLHIDPSDFKLTWTTA